MNPSLNDGTLRTPSPGSDAVNQASETGNENGALATNNQEASLCSVWFLSGQISSTEPVRHIPIHTSPFQVGRRRNVALSLPCATVSGVHAELFENGNQLCLKDLKSTNGTFVNGKRVVGTVPLSEDDLVQFADVAFRVRRQSAEVGGMTVHEDVCDMALALVQFDKIMSQRAVIPYYQPIVALKSLETIGYEVLGRSDVFGLETPGAMFHAASQLDLEVELSRMFRWEGLTHAVAFPKTVPMFVNTHPSELDHTGLIESLTELREAVPDRPIVLEIHEAAITNPPGMQQLRESLDDLKMGLAYDDFGAGQTRLVELIEVRPDYLKFDMSLIRNIEQGSAQRQQMLQTLVQMVRELNVIPLAEGIETEGEHRTCTQLGFELAQGFFYGKPAPVTAFHQQPA